MMWDQAVLYQRPILVVDDDRVIREWLAELLSDAGYSVACAENGRAALHRIAEIGAPALVLLDVLMPEMNGYQLLQALRRDPELAAVPVVMLSAFRPDCAPPCSASLSAWIEKPADVDRLLATIERFRLRHVSQSSVLDSHLLA